MQTATTYVARRIGSVGTDPIWMVEGPASQEYGRFRGVYTVHFKRRGTPVLRHIPGCLAKLRAAIDTAITTVEQA